MHRKTAEHAAPTKGAIAQLVEHRTENPCVPGSNPGGTTRKKSQLPHWQLAFLFYSPNAKIRQKRLCCHSRDTACRVRIQFAANQIITLPAQRARLNCTPKVGRGKKSILFKERLELHRVRPCILHTLHPRMTEQIRTASPNVKSILKNGTLLCPVNHTANQ